MKNLREEILRIEPKIDLLHDLLGFGRFAEVTITADGFFLGRKHGDIGFNEFLGHPSDQAIERTRRLFPKLSSCSQQKIMFIFMKRGYPLEYLQTGEARFSLNQETHQASSISSS